MNYDNSDNLEKKSLYSQLEDEVLSFWNKSEIFKKSLLKEAPLGNYVFNDGPPFITGLPHYATLLPSIAKDVIPRYKTMRGYRVERIWGWDCHGLPAENQVEKQLGLKNKKDIESLGIDKFIGACRSYVDHGSEQWEWYINKIGRWVDMKNAYRTMDLKFMESVIWSFKELYNMDFIYEGYRNSLHCPRCATPLSKFEITMDAGSYQDVTDKSIVIKFKLLNFKENTFILAWTTTPWTLPGNLALAIGNEIEYVKVKIKNKNDEYYILAKSRLQDIFIDYKYEIITNIKSEELIGLKYEPLYQIDNDNIKESDKVYRIYNADFVSTEDGTGVVHIAPNFGEEDFQLGENIGLPIVELMDENGIYTEAANKWSGYYFKQANEAILSDLKERKIIFFDFDYTHSYPFCYRCATPLIYKTQKAWYLNIQKIKLKMLETNKEINWIPEYFKEGRFQKNIEGAPDWCLSRSRYWGSPIPVWKCIDCNKIEVLGSLKEIESKSGKKVIDLHRPHIDEHEFFCDCGGKMKRVKEVLDCWFESGAMPFAQYHYPFEKKEDFKKMFPADFIIEYTGQLRGWFYYLHVLSNALFNSISFKNVIVSGVLAGTDGRKMSKSFGNYPDPRLTLKKYGSDALRMYFMSSHIMLGEDMSLSEIEIQDTLRKNIIILWNVLKFYELFSTIDKESLPEDFNSRNILDVWILARLKQVNLEITENLEKYNLPGAARPITKFIDDLSTWYLRRSRDRFKGDDQTDKIAALITLKHVLLELSKLIAPIIPFIAEQIWQKITKYDFKNNNQSVHLESWPQASVLNNYDLEVIIKMEQARKVVELGLAQRDQTGFKIRQPLLKLLIYNLELPQEYLELIKKELNVKEVICLQDQSDLKVVLDTTITEDLQLEGFKREIVRFVNAARKDFGFNLSDRTIIFYNTDNQLILKTIQIFQKEILKETLSNEIKVAPNDIILKNIKINNVDFKMKIEKFNI